MQWYYSKNGTQLGPVGEGELRSKIASGEVSPTDLVWKEGMTDWLPSARVTEFAVAASPSSDATPPAPPSSAGAPVPSPYSSPLQPSSANGADIPNYLWQSIVVTLFCCLPFGIVGIVFAAKVDGLKQAGNTQAALEASQSAKKWCLAAFITGLVVLVLYIGLMVVAAVSGGMQQ